MILCVLWLVTVPFASFLWYFKQTEEGGLSLCGTIFYLQFLSCLGKVAFRQAHDALPKTQVRKDLSKKIS